MENSHSNSDGVEVPALVISAALVDAMVRKTQHQVAVEMGVRLDRLLDMIELKREFSRRVLRYLGFRRKVTYFHAR